MFDAYHKWLGIPPHEQPPDHYRLLGIARFESDPEVIAAAADRQMAHLRMFQAGPRAEACQRLLGEVTRARLCLLNPEKKVAYDAHLRALLATGAPFARPAADDVSPWDDPILPAMPKPPGRACGISTPRGGRPIRRLVTVASAALAAAACAWLLARYFGTSDNDELAQRVPPAVRKPAAAELGDTRPLPHQELRPVRPPPNKAAVGQGSRHNPVPNPWARAGGAAQQDLFPKTGPPTGSSLPPLDPKSQESIPAKPPGQPAAAPPWAAPASQPLPASGQPSPAAPVQGPPKISALAPPGSIPAKSPQQKAPPPTSSEAELLFQDALGLVAQGRYPVGYKKLNEALKVDRNRYEVLFALGLLEAVVAHDWDNAEKHFSQCAKLEPKSVAVLNNLALVRLRTNKAGLAIRHWDAVLDTGSTPPDEVVQNVARVCVLVKNRRLILPPENVRALDLLARKLDVAARAKQLAMFRYLPPDGEAAKGFRWPAPPGLAEDWCMFCLGFGTVKCPACVRGAVRSPATRILAADRDTGTVVTQTGTARSRCPRCGGTGWVDCQTCSDGHQR